MKKLFIIAMLGLFTVATAYAQNEGSITTVKGEKKEKQDPEMKSLFGGDEKAFGGYLGINSHYTKIDGKDAFFIGAELDAVINHSLNVGFKGYGLVSATPSNRMNDLGEQLYLAMGYGGINIEPVLFYTNAVHLTLPILFGGGGITEYTRNWDQDYHYHYHHYPYNYDFFFVVEPGVQLEVSVFSFMRLSTGASYRATSQVNLIGLNGNDLSGFNYDLSIKFGWF